MANPPSYLMAAVMLLLLISTGNLRRTEACDAVQLSWCLQSIVSYMPPTAECCQKLKSQESCLCQEMSDPTFGGYLHLPGAKMVCNVCNVTFPNCWR